MCIRDRTNCCSETFKLNSGAREGQRNCWVLKPSNWSQPSPSPSAVRWLQQNLMAPALSECSLEAGTGCFGTLIWVSGAFVHPFNLLFWLSCLPHVNPAGSHGVFLPQPFAEFPQWEATCQSKLNSILILPMTQSYPPETQGRSNEIYPLQLNWKCLFLPNTSVMFIWPTSPSSVVYLQIPTVPQAITFKHPLEMLDK